MRVQISIKPVDSLLLFLYQPLADSSEFTASNFGNSSYVSYRVSFRIILYINGSFLSEQLFTQVYFNQITFIYLCNDHLRWLIVNLVFFVGIWNKGLLISSPNKFQFIIRNYLFFLIFHNIQKNIYFSWNSNSSTFYFSSIFFL